METETVIYNQTNFETYRNNFKYYYLIETDDFTFEGEIVLGNGEHGGESYKYVSHLEEESEDEMDDVQREAVEKYLDDNINELVFNAKKL